MQVWLKIAPETKVEALAQDAVRYAYIMKQDEVFALYLSSDNELKLYLFAQKPYFEKSSKGVFVPYNEWVHIRLRISMSKGYILEVYSQSDLFNPLSQTWSTVALKDQLPGGKFYLGNDFQGEISELQFWEDDHLNLQEIAPELKHLYTGTRSGYLLSVTESTQINYLFWFKFTQDWFDGKSFLQYKGKNKKAMGVAEKSLTWTAEILPAYLMRNRWDGIACDDDLVYPVSKKDTAFVFNYTSIHIKPIETPKNTTKPLEPPPSGGRRL